MVLTALLIGCGLHSLKVGYCVFLKYCEQSPKSDLHGDITGFVLQTSLRLRTVAGMEMHLGWATAQRRALAVRLRVARKVLAR